MRISTVPRLLRFVTRHPLNRKRRAAALRRVVAWQVGSRLVPGPVVVPFVNGSRLLARPGMPTATSIVYTGMNEFDDMAFVLHLLRKDDLFLDVGANIGSYTVLAAAGVGSTCMAVEPIPQTFENLLDNIHLNRLEQRVHALNVGVGRAAGMLRFTCDRSATNHVATDPELAAGTKTVEVQVQPLDDLVQGAEPLCIKVDVEGFEPEVVAGGLQTLSRPSLLAVLMETNGLTRQYGLHENALHEEMLGLGFTAWAYSAWERQIAPRDDGMNPNGNTLYLRNGDAVRDRVKNAPAFSIGDWQI